MSAPTLAAFRAMMRHEPKQYIAYTEHIQILECVNMVVRMKLSEEHTTRLKLEECMQNFGNYLLVPT